MLGVALVNIWDELLNPNGKWNDYSTWRFYILTCFLIEEEEELFYILQNCYDKESFEIKTRTHFKKWCNRTPFLTAGEKEVTQ